MITVWTGGHVPPHFLKWRLRVMFPSVFEVKVLYVFKYWLTTVLAWWRFCNYSTKFPKLAFCLYFVHGPRLCCVRQRSYRSCLVKKLFQVTELFFSTKALQCYDRCWALTLQASIIRNWIIRSGHSGYNIVLLFLLASVSLALAFEVHHFDLGLLASITSLPNPGTSS